MREINLLSDQVRQTAYEIHAYHGHGHLEKIYENALAHKLRKAAKSLATEHEAQILGYLKSCRIKHGLLINFGSNKFEIRKYKWGWE
jgi:hypothetical protein